MSAHLSRRDFVRSGLVAAGAGIIVPPIFAKSVFAANSDGNQNDRVLVILQLGGGNDGLNTVIPFADPTYGNVRPTIGITGDKALHINNSVGLHPNLVGIKSLYDQGQVAIVQGVGYPNPTYSHFEGLYVWEHADPSRLQQDGWLGKLLATQYDTLGHPLTGCALGEAGVPSELRAPSTQLTVIDSLATYDVQGGAGRTIAAPALYQKTPGIYGALFDQSMSTARQGIAALKRTDATYQPMADYGTTKAVYGSKNDLASALQLTAELIVSQPTVKVCHVVLGGFDTHQQEDTRHAALMKDVDVAVTAFMKDIAAHNMADRVVMASWSEFGRRVAENGSNGTDHGSAAPMFVIGKSVKGGLLGEQPSLTSLVDGNMQYTVDFRSVYQSLIQDWLRADAKSVLGATFPSLTVV